MRYAVFSVGPESLPMPVDLAYGVNDKTTHARFSKQRVRAAVVEQCANIRAASASVGLRNAARRDLTSLLGLAHRRGAPAELTDALTNLHVATFDADPSRLVDNSCAARTLLEHYGIKLPRSWADDMRAIMKLQKRLDKYQQAL